MINLTENLKKYLKEAFEVGMSEEEIEKTLLEKGWDVNDVRAALNEAKGVEDAKEGFLAPEGSIARDAANTISQATGEQGGQLLKSNVLLPASDLLSKFFNVFRENFKLLFGVALIPAVALIVLSSVLFLIAIFFISGDGLLNNGFFSPEAYADIFGDVEKIKVVNIGFAALFFISFVLNIWTQASLIFALKDRGKTTITKSFKNGFSKIIPFFVVTFLVMLAVGVASVFLFIPGIIFAIWLSFAVYLLIYEGKGGIIALIKSKDLVSGNWWNLFGRMAILAPLIWAIFYAVNILAQIFFSSFVFFLPIGTFISIILQILAQTVATSLSVCFIAIVYEDFKRLKSGVKPEEHNDIRN